LCRRGDVWNPNNAYLCSDHFTNDDFERDLKAELLGYKPKVKYLKKNVLPSLNLPLDHSQTPLSESSLNRRNRMNVKHTKQVYLLISLFNYGRYILYIVDKTISTLYF